jgi:hypothetical protein
MSHGTVFPMVLQSSLVSLEIKGTSCHGGRHMVATSICNVVDRNLQRKTKVLPTSSRLYFLAVLKHADTHVAMLMLQGGPLLNEYKSNS